jgi:hypothetical protein
VAERIVISSEQGKLEIEDPDKSEQLSQVLREPAAFGEFVENPREFVRGYGITIDQKVSDQLHQALQGVKSAEELETSGYALSTTTAVPLTVGAITLGVFAIATAKTVIAIAR